MAEMTAEALAELKRELERLETVERREIAQRIKTAREWGDLKENAEYHDAKHTQSLLETKILRLREAVETAVVVEPSASNDEVGFGSTVTVEDAEEAGREQRFTIVSAGQADPAKGMISSASPVAQALIGARPGATVEVELPRGVKRFRVTAIEA